MAFNYSPIVWFFSWVGALITVFYMVRLMTLVFYGPKATTSEHLHEAPPLMALTLILLSLFSLLGGLIGVPHILHGILPTAKKRRALKKAWVMR